MRCWCVTVGFAVLLIAVPAHADQAASPDTEPTKKPEQAAVTAAPLGRKVLIFDLAQPKGRPLVVSAAKQPGAISSAPILLGEPTVDGNGDKILHEKKMLLDQGKTPPKAAVKDKPAGRREDRKNVEDDEQEQESSDQNDD
jgi:hypothetical protein